MLSLIHLCTLNLIAAQTGFHVSNGDILTGEKRATYAHFIEVHEKGLNEPFQFVGSHVSSRHA